MLVFDLEQCVGWVDSGVGIWGSNIRAVIDPAGSRVRYGV